MKRVAKPILSVLIIAVIVLVSVFQFVSFEAEAASGNISVIAGKNRYETAIKIADIIKAEKKISKFENIIVATGQDFPDALSGSYLANVAEAPILLTYSGNIGRVVDYIRKNLATEGKVFILGSRAAVPRSIEDQLKGSGIAYERLEGKTRYETNLRILEKGDQLYAEKNGGLMPKEILLVSGNSYADAVSGGATGLPILLVNKNLTDEQKAYLNGKKGAKFTVLGGPTSVLARIETFAQGLGSTDRRAGKTRYSTSVSVAKKYFGTSPKEVIVVKGEDFPDGISVAPLAQLRNAPILLSDKKALAQSYNYELNGKVQKATLIGDLNKKYVCVPGAFLTTKSRGWVDLGNGYEAFVNKYGAIQQNQVLENGIKIPLGEGGVIAKQGRQYLHRQEELKSYYTAIIIEIDRQELTYVKNGIIKFTSPVITGKKNKWDTPKGTFMVRSKGRKVLLVGADYANVVEYWMPFIRSEYGIHDGWWRDAWEFKDKKRYITGGSHGCVNLPPKNAETLYYMVSVGTPVIIK